MSTNMQINAKGQIVVAGEFSFTNAHKLRELGCNFITESESPVFDLQQVIAEDNSGLALLTAWTRFAKQQGKSVFFVNLPEQLRDIAKLSGLDQLLPIRCTNNG